MDDTLPSIHYIIGKRKQLYSGQIQRPNVTSAHMQMIAATRSNCPGYQAHGFQQGGWLEYELSSSGVAMKVIDSVYDSRL